MRNQTLKIALIIFALVSISYQQRGGGGSSGGSSSGGGSFFNGGSSSGGSSYNSYRTPSYNYNTPSYTNSYTSGYNYPGGYYRPSYGNSYYSSGYQGGGVVGKIIGIIFIVIIGIIALIIFFCTCGCICCCKETNPSISNANTNLNTNYSPAVPYNNNNLTEFDRQKQLHNRVNIYGISDQQFQLKLNQFVDLIKGTSNKTSQFTYKQGIISYPIDKVDVKVDKQAEFIYRIQLRGADQLGAWLGRGYFLNTDIGVAVWWMKDYFDKNLAGQTGQWSHLMYKSTQCNYNDWNGVWYYVGFEGNFEYSGTWHLGLGYIGLPPILNNNPNIQGNMLDGNQKQFLQNILKLGQGNKNRRNQNDPNRYSNVEYAQL